MLVEWAACLSHQNIVDNYPARNENNVSIIYCPFYQPLAGIISNQMYHNLELRNIEMTATILF
jgi:hypothetical protein